MRAPGAVAGYPPLTRLRREYAPFRNDDRCVPAGLPKPELERSIQNTVSVLLPTKMFEEPIFWSAVTSKAVRQARHRFSWIRKSGVARNTACRTHSKNEAPLPPNLQHNKIAHCGERIISIYKAAENRL